MEYSYSNPKSIVIQQHRWNVKISIVDSEGVSHVYVASADAGFTDNSQIWFSTEEEYNNIHY